MCLPPICVGAGLPANTVAAATVKGGWRLASRPGHRHVSTTAPTGIFTVSTTAQSCESGFNRERAVQAYAGAEVRIRWSKAASDALAPSPTAMTICLYGTVVTSPAANPPGMLVWPLASTMISPRGDSSTVPFSQSVSVSYTHLRAHET